MAERLGMSIDISIHALREEGDFRPRSIPARSDGISIHALREEGDCLKSTSWWPTSNFYPRPPRGGRPGQGVRDSEQDRFLSTPSARRATGSSTRRQLSSGYFYPRPPRGGRPH